jgi:hypothetical protein
LSLLIADNDQTLTGHFLDEIVAGLRDLSLMADKHPLLRKDFGSFFFKEAR